MTNFRSLAASLALLVLLNGCATVQLARDLVPGPDLAGVVVGAAKKDVERELGKPIREEHNVSVYEYRTSHVSPGMAAFLLPVTALLDMSGFGLIYIDNVNRISRLNTHEMDIVYGPGGRVIALSHAELKQKFSDWLLHADQGKQIQALTAAANGYAPAQFTQALRYRYGIWDTPIDAAKAYMWARLAELGGHPGAREALARWTKTMTSAQLADGERLLREWKPASGG